MSTITIGRKLYVGVASLVLLTLALGTTSCLTLQTILGRVQNITQSTAKKQELAAQLALDNAEMLSAVREIEVLGFLKDPATLKKYQADFVAKAEDMQSVFTTLAPLLSAAQIKRDLEELRATSPRLIELEQVTYKAALRGDMTGALTSYKELLLPLSTHKTLINNIFQFQQVLFSKDAQTTTENIDSSRWIIGILLCLELLISIGMIYSVRQILALLHRSIDDLSSASEQIASAANQVSASSQSLASNSSQQAASIEETSSASSEVNSMAQRTTASSKETADIVARSQKNVLNTKQSLDEMVIAMEGINSSSQKISKIIKVIDEIAFQTNILALNAAVEAARAGEAGMGFAVVADEVRNLAQRCAQAAKDTADLIDDSIQKSASGKTKVDQVAIAIRAITGESATIKTLIDEISLASIEQSRGMDQITQAITQMEQVTQTTAANAEESAAAAQQLKGQAETLKEVVDTLKKMVSGNHHSTPRFHSITSASDLSRAKRVTNFQSAITFPVVKPATSKIIHRNAMAASSRITSVVDFPLDDDFSEF